MKILSYLSVVLLILFAATGCTGKGSVKKVSETSTVPDTGFTGIKRYTSRNYLIKEVTFKNGVRQGLMKTFYQDGLLRQTFWYENNLREDSSCWYYPNGKLFRTTPYKHDTIDGIQKQFYGSGDIKAKIGYRKGFRTEFFQEFEKNGKLFRDYPEVVVGLIDEYKSKGVYHIMLSLSDKSKNVKFYRGDFTDGRFDTTMVKSIKTIDGKAVLDLKKTGSPKPDSVNIIVEISTLYSNRYLISKKISLPYDDLN
jgi:hypothetical protein